MAEAIVGRGKVKNKENKAPSVPVSQHLKSVARDFVFPNRVLKDKVNTAQGQLEKLERELHIKSSRKKIAIKRKLKAKKNKDKSKGSSSSSSSSNAAVVVDKSHPGPCVPSLPMRIRIPSDVPPPAPPPSISSTDQLSADLYRRSRGRKRANRLQQQQQGNDMKEMQIKKQKLHRKKRKVRPRPAPVILSPVPCSPPPPSVITPEPPYVPHNSPQTSFCITPEVVHEIWEV